MTMPPNEPATPGTCFICGGAAGTEDERSLGTHAGKYRACATCQEKFPYSGRWESLDSEYDRRKSVPTPEFVPAVGEMCEGTWECGRRFTGKFSRIDADGDAWLTESEYQGGLVCVKATSLRSLKPAPAPGEQACPGRVGSKPCELPAHHAAPCMVEQKAVPARSGSDRVPAQASELGPARPEPPEPGQSPRIIPNSCAGCAPQKSRNPGWKCAYGCDPEEDAPPDPYAGYDLNAWGISSKRRPASTPYGPACLECGQETTRVNHAGEPSCVDCQCMVADEILGKGPANEPIDRRIASARHATEREAGVKRFDAWVSVRHARKP